jgi:hypothetical protein|nr:MAG TPA: hypothetical protein [Caudoviricetes sp.]
MLYQFLGNELQLIKYKITVEIEGAAMEFYAVDDAAKADYLSKYPEAEVSAVDNAGYEWLDGVEFTNPEEAEMAISMGRSAYEEYKQATDPTAQMLDMDYRISLLELGVTENDVLSM